MADDLDRAFADFVDAYHAGEGPDPDTYAERVGARADELIGLLDAFLTAAPIPEPSDAAVVRHRALAIYADPTLLVPAATRDFPNTLTALRVAVEPRRASFAARLADALGLEHRAAKVKRLYADLESGVLPPDGLAPRLRATLASLLGVEERRLDAPARPSPAAAPATAYLRLDAAEAAAESDDRRRDEDWDEVDELFRGPRL